jgi:hypothetical protein
MYGRGFCLIITALGAIYLWLSLQLPLQTLNGPGAGFFPILVGGSLVLSGLVASLRPRTAISGAFLRADSGRMILSVAAGLVLFCLLLDLLGFIVCGTFVMLVTLKQFKVSWSFAAAISIVGAVATYVLFVSLLGLQLPAGQLARSLN